MTARETPEPGEARQSAGAGDLPVLREIYELRPWYHDFSRLGLRTDFGQWSRPGQRLRRWLRTLGGRAFGALRIEKGERLLGRSLLRGGLSSHRVNQAVKEDWLVPRIAHCLAEFERAPSCLDLFCADGYYSCLMAHTRPDARVVGIDLDPEETKRAAAAARVLGFDTLRFVTADAHSYLASGDEAFDLVFCSGGLYHLADPRGLLESIRRRTRGFLVLQSVVTLETEAANYFVAPAPGWRHGCRFTHARLEAWLEELGWRIVEGDRGELPGNHRLRDRGSSYFVCEVPGGQERQSGDS